MINWRKKCGENQSKIRSWWLHGISKIKYSVSLEWILRSKSQAISFYSPVYTYTSDITTKTYVYMSFSRLTASQKYIKYYGAIYLFFNG